MTAPPRSTASVTTLHEVGVPRTGGPNDADGTERIERGATLAEQVYANVRRGLLMGRWRPGARISVRQLAQDLAVSVTPVREAMLQLAKEGALEMPQGAGVRVPVLCRTDYEEIVRVRLALEPMAAEMAAGFATPEQIADLRERNEWLGNALGRDEFGFALQIDTGLHLSICRMARQPLLLSIIESLLLRAGPTRTRLPAPYRKTLVGYQRHRLIIDALEAGDGATVREAIRCDISEGADIILRDLAP